MSNYYKLKFAVLEVRKAHGTALDHGDLIERTRHMIRTRQADGWTSKKGDAPRIVAEYKRQCSTDRGEYLKAIAAELRHAIEAKESAALIERHREEPDDSIQLRPTVGRMPRRLGFDFDGAKPVLLIPRCADRFYCEPASIEDATKLRDWLGKWIDLQRPEDVDL
jgi:hypothetical protein